MSVVHLSRTTRLLQSTTTELARLIADVCHTSPALTIESEAIQLLIESTDDVIDLVKKSQTRVPSAARKEFGRLQQQLENVLMFLEEQLESRRNGVESVTIFGDITDILRFNIKIISAVHQISVTVERSGVEVPEWFESWLPTAISDCNQIQAVADDFFQNTLEKYPQIHTTFESAKSQSISPVVVVELPDIPEGSIAQNIAKPIPFDSYSVENTESLEQQLSDTNNSLEATDMLEHSSNRVLSETSPYSCSGNATDVTVVGELHTVVSDTNTNASASVHISTDDHENSFHFNQHHQQRPNRSTVVPLPSQPLEHSTHPSFHPIYTPPVTTATTAAIPVVRSEPPKWHSPKPIPVVDIDLLTVPERVVYFESYRK